MTPHLAITMGDPAGIGPRNGYDASREFPTPTPGAQNGGGSRSSSVRSTSRTE